MVYICIVNGRPYAYRSVRVPGRKHPMKEYLGPADDLEVVRQVVVQRLRKAVRKAVAEVIPTPWSAAGEDELVQAVVREIADLVREVSPMTRTYKR